MDAILWSKVPPADLKELFLHNPLPPFRGTPLVNDSLKQYFFERAAKAAIHNAAVVVRDGDTVLAAGQVYEIPYLSRYWGLRMGGLGHIVTRGTVDAQMRQATSILINELVREALKLQLDFLSGSVPGKDLPLVQAFEEHGFRYAEGFINMVGPTTQDYTAFHAPGVKIRMLEESDFKSIDEAYRSVDFPSRYVTDGGFDPKRGYDLYPHRYREVFDQQLGVIFVAECDNHFAGALIGIVDHDLSVATGIKTNVLSGMGIVVHPRAARRGVSLALIAERQHWYAQHGVEWVSFGANFNNLPMLRGLAKLGLVYGSLDMTYHRWLKPERRYCPVGSSTS